MAGFHSLTPPKPAVANRSPSGLNARALTKSDVPAEQLSGGVAGGRVPQPDSPVAAASRQQVARRAERHRSHRRCWPRQWPTDRIVVRRIPQLHPLDAGGDQ